MTRPPSLHKKPDKVVLHRDSLFDYESAKTLTDKLRVIHEFIRDYHPFIKRVSVAVYDAKTDLLSTYSHSTEGEAPLIHYEAHLSDAKSLAQIATSGQARVVNDLSIFQDGKQEHTRKISLSYKASYTLPMFHDEKLIGFTFFNSDDSYCFDNKVLKTLDIVAHLISTTVANELLLAHVIIATLNTMKEVAIIRDGETGTHIERVAHYARLIAMELAKRFDLDDEYVEHVYIYAPLHDIGKIGIPDSILLKESKLNGDEISVMRKHVTKGVGLIDAMLSNLDMEQKINTLVLRNIVEFHHERYDGNGYIKGVKGEDIPLEARIVAVADVFDALTSSRHYKRKWGNDEAVSWLKDNADTQFDPVCVDALITRMDKVADIQENFSG